MITKNKDFLEKIYRESKKYGIHSGIILITIIALFSDFIWGKEFYNNTVLANTTYTNTKNIDPQKVELMLSQLSQLAPPLSGVISYQSESYLAEGNVFFDKPSITNTVISGLPRDKITTYVVSEGETYWTIAYKFELDIDSLLWSNEIKNIDTVEVGKELTILPSTGLLHVVVAGDKPEILAKNYDVPVEKIIEKNQLASASDVLTAGEKLFIPGARRFVPQSAAPIQASPIPNYATQSVAPPKYGSGSQTYLGPALAGTGSFVWPINSSGRFITQYFTWVTKYYKHTGVDMDWRNGTDIIAADRGTVVAVSYGWGGGYGNHIIIDHGNGYQTLYAHLSSIKVTPGQSIIQGQSIAVMGTTGISTGVHLHFEIRQSGVAINPLDFVK